MCSLHQQHSWWPWAVTGWCTLLKSAHRSTDVPHVKGRWPAERQCHGASEAQTTRECAKISSVGRGFAHNNQRGKISSTGCTWRSRRPKEIRGNGVSSRKIFHADPPTAPHKQLRFTSTSHRRQGTKHWLHYMVTNQPLWIPTPLSPSPPPCGPPWRQPIARPCPGNLPACPLLPLTHVPWHPVP